MSAARLRVSRCAAPGLSTAALRTAHPALFPLAEAQAEALPGAAGAWVISCGAGPEGGAALWWLSPEPSPALEPATLGAEALRAVEDARRLLRALPWGWSALPDRPLLLGRAARFDAAEGVAPPATVDGRSLSGAALLALSARYYGEPLSQNILASVDLDPRTGRALAVEGVEAKAAGLRRLLSNLSTLYVAKAQAERWGQALLAARFDAVKVVGVDSATELVSAALRPAERLAQLDDPAIQRTFAHLRRTSLEGGMAAALSWPAVRHTLAALRGRLPDEGPTLALLEGVATRYARAEAVESPPDAVFAAALALRSRRQRHVHLAHAVQWAADAAAPLPAGVEEAVPPPEQGQLAHRVHGAWARWLLVAGPGPTEDRAARALKAHQRIVEALVDDDELSEQSSSLAVWLQLSGGLGDRAAFAAAEAHLRRFAADADAEPRDLAFLRLARARGALWLGNAPPAIVDELRALRGCVSAGAATGPYAGLGFLDAVIYRTLRLLGDEAALPPAGPDGAPALSPRVQAHLALAEGTLTVDQAIQAEDRCYRAAAQGVAGPPADGEQLRKERLLKLYPY